MSHNLIIFIEVREPRHSDPFSMQRFSQIFQMKCTWGCTYFLGLNDTFHNVRTVDAKSLVFIVCISSMNLDLEGMSLPCNPHFVYFSEEKTESQKKEVACWGPTHSWWQEPALRSPLFTDSTSCCSLTLPFNDTCQFQGVRVEWTLCWFLSLLPLLNGNFLEGKGCVCLLRSLRYLGELYKKSWM